MRTIEIPASTAWLIDHMAYNFAGAGLAGLTTLIVRIWRPSDGYWWNWNAGAGAFQLSPSSGDRDKAMVEAEATLLPGLYYVSWPGTIAGQYIAFITLSSGTSDYNAPEPIRLSVGALPTAAAVAALPTAADTATATASVLANAHGAGSWATATGFATHSAADVWAVGTRTLTGIGSSGIASQTSVDARPTAGAIADAVWDELLVGHTTAGSAGAAAALVDVAVSSRATASAVWATAEGSPSSGTYGYAIWLLREGLEGQLDASVADDGTITLYSANGDVLLTWPLRDGSNGPVATPTGSPARRGRATRGPGATP